MQIFRLLTFLALLPTSTEATRLTFTEPEVSDVGSGYGSRVSATSMGIFTYGSEEGFTPNVVVSNPFRPTAQDGYGDLDKVLTTGASGGGEHILSLTFTADPGFRVRLHRLDLAARNDLEADTPIIDHVTVLDTRGIALAPAQIDLVIPKAGDHRQVDFPATARGTEITLHIVTTTVACGDSGETVRTVGLDNLVFSQEPILDSDGGGASDYWERQQTPPMNPADPGDDLLDFDNDGLTNAQEEERGTDPRRADSDWDGQSDGQEVLDGSDPAASIRFTDLSQSLLAWADGQDSREPNFLTAGGSRQFAFRSDTDGNTRNVEVSAELDTREPATQHLALRGRGRARLNDYRGYVQYTDRVNFRVNEETEFRFDWRTFSGDGDPNDGNEVHTQTRLVFVSLLRGKYLNFWPDTQNASESRRLFYLNEYPPNGTAFDRSEVVCGTLQPGIWYTIYVRVELDSIRDFNNVPHAIQTLEWGLTLGSGGLTEDDPVLPDPPGSGAFPPQPCFCFPRIPRDRWADPIPADGFEFAREDGTMFTAINGFPSGFRSPFNVEVDGQIVGTFSPGQRCNFEELLGGPVEKFRVTGISRPVDAEDPTAFPIRIDFEEAVGSFTMTPLQLDITDDFTNLSDGAEEYLYTFDGDFATAFTIGAPTITAVQEESSFRVSGAGVGTWQSSEFVPPGDETWSATVAVNLPADLESVLGAGQGLRVGLQVADDLGNTFTATLGGSRGLAEDPVAFSYEVSTTPVTDPLPLPASSPDGNGCIILHFDPATGILTARTKDFATIFGLDLGTGGANWNLGALTVGLFAETLGGASLATTDPAVLDNFAGVSGVPVPILAVTDGEGDDIDLRWWGIKGYRYQLYESDDLDEWDPVGDQVLGTEDLLEFSAPTADQSRFFRVGVER